MAFGKGLRRSTPSRITHRLRASSHSAIAKAMLGGPVGAGDLSSFCPSVLDQGATSTCHAHSAAMLIACARAAAGRPLGWTPSPLVIASTTYSDMRQRYLPNGPMPPLADTGAELQDDADALKTWGIGPMGGHVSGRYSDVPDGSPFPEPDPAALVVAGAEIVSGEYAIPVDHNAIVTVAACIDAKVPVWLGTFVDTAFERMAAYTVAQPANTADVNGGGHAIGIVGYRTVGGVSAGGSALQFRVRNSWGPGWCDGGSCWASENWLLACWDLWPMAVAS